MTNLQLYNKIRTLDNKIAADYHRKTLSDRAALGSSEAKRLLEKLRPKDQRPSKTSKS